MSARTWSSGLELDQLMAGSYGRRRLSGVVSSLVKYIVQIPQYYVSQQLSRHVTNISSRHTIITKTLTLKYVIVNKLIL